MIDFNNSFDINIISDNNISAIQVKNNTKCYDAFISIRIEYNFRIYYCVVNDVRKIIINQFYYMFIVFITELLLIIKLIININIFWLFYKMKVL